MKLGKLFTSFYIGTMKIRNRIVMPPMATHNASPEGLMTDRQIPYYLERARGGVGYSTVGHTGILQRGEASPKMLLISSDEHASSMGSNFRSWGHIRIRPLSNDLSSHPQKGLTLKAGLSIIA